MKTRIFLIFSLVLALQAHAQIIWELPIPVRYNVDKALVFVEEKLQDENLEEAQKIKWSSVLSQLYNKKGQFAQGATLLFDIPDLDQVPADIQATYFLAKAINEKFRNKPEEALDDYVHAETAAKKLKNNTRILQVMIEKAEFFRKYYQHEQALTTIIEVLAILEQSTDVSSEVRAYALNRRAAILTETGKLDESVVASRKCIRLASEIGNFYLVGASMNEIGYIFKNRRLLDSSFYYYEQAEANFRKGNMLLDAMQVWMNRLELCIHNQYRMTEAIPELKVFIKEVKEKDIQQPIRMAFFYLAEFYERNKDYKEAMFYWKEYHQAFAAEFQQESMNQLSNLHQEYKNRKIEEENGRIQSELETKQKELTDKDKRFTWILLGFILVVGGLFVTIQLYAKTKKLTTNLRIQNEQKDVLVQEVHHRVKNNLHFIHSLLEMQKNAASNIEEAVGLEEASLRISCVSLVHEFLYQGEDYDKVNLRNYMGQLLQHLETTFSQPDKKVQVKLEIEEAEFSIQNCTAMGLLIAELYTNSVKYAFVDLDKPVFQVAFRKVAHFNTYELVVRDNGQNPVNFEEKKGVKTLGMRLIDIFSRQLKGDYEIGWENGFYYKLNFGISES